MRRAYRPACVDRAPLAPDLMDQIRGDLAELGSLLISKTGASSQSHCHGPGGSNAPRSPNGRTTRSLGMARAPTGPRLGHAVRSIEHLDRYDIPARVVVQNQAGLFFIALVNGDVFIPLKACWTRLASCCRASCRMSRFKRDWRSDKGLINPITSRSSRIWYDRQFSA